MFKHFLTKYGFKESDVLIIPYGSRVYGTHNEKSDYDYLAIVLGGQTGIEYDWHDINITIYSHKDFQDQLKECKIHALEAYFHQEIPFYFKLNLGKLRSSLSEKASHSFVKAKKKIEVGTDYYIGWKSLFHSLRILNFGIQIGKHGKIVNYGEANHYWDEIKNANQYNWQYFKAKYQPIYNELSTEFKKLAPKS